MKFFATLITIFFSLGPHTCPLEDYYWREYVGETPEDAIIAGKDINNKNVHIGQAYVHDAGLIVTQIFPGVKEVYVTYKGVRKIDKYVKILCGEQADFYWMQANHTNLHLELIDKHAVIGGHEDAYGYMNVGRISYGGEIRIGKVNSFWPEAAYFYFDNNGTEKRISSYQVLMYIDKSINIDVRFKD